jgi:transcriptional regulator with XRE-family HTH domain
MGAARPKQKWLGEKLRRVRLSMGISQTEMLHRLGAQDLIAYTQISRFESGEREPSLQVILLYARAANVSVEALIDDELDLPARLPSAKKHEGVRRRRP